MKKLLLTLILALLALSLTACAGGKNVKIKRGTTEIADYAYENNDKLETVEIPDTVTRIGRGAFTNCKNLKSLSLLGSVTSIGTLAFYNTGLSELTLPAEAAGIASAAFADCKRLTSVTFAAGTPGVSHGIFKDCVSLTQISLPDSVTYIRPNAFSGCKALSAVTLPAALTSLSGFDGCTGLSEISIPAAVTEIDDEAFKGCTGLTEIALPAALTAIGRDAFRGCTGLSEIVLPDSVASLGDGAFKGCAGLTRVTLPAALETAGADVFSGCDNLTQVVVPDGIRYISSDLFINTPLDVLPWTLPQTFENAPDVSASQEKLALGENAKIIPYHKGELFCLMPAALRTFDAREADLALVTDVRHRERHDYLGGKAYDTITDVYLCAPDGTARLLASITNAPPPTGASPLYGANASAEQIWSAIERFF